MPGDCPAALRLLPVRLWKTFPSKPNHSGRRLKLFAFPPESAFSIRPECCSEPQRNEVQLQTGIAFTFDRIPHHRLLVPRPTSQNPCQMRKEQCFQLSFRPSPTKRTCTSGLSFRHILPTSFGARKSLVDSAHDKSVKSDRIRRLDSSTPPLTNTNRFDFSSSSGRSGRFRLFGIFHFERKGTKQFHLTR
jgi:hypothetical protein